MMFSESDIFLVTGASSGIGRATALALNAAGATVLANGRDEEKLRSTRDAAPRSENMITAPLDIANDIDNLPVWLAGLAAEYGKLRGMACCAGITVNAPMSFYNMGLVARVFDICCHAPLRLGGAFCGRRVNKGPGSAIVYIAAAAAVEPNPGQGIYAAAKGGLVAGARCLAREAASHKIRVNCISPGLVRGPMLEATVRQLGDAFLQREESLYPLGLGSPENVADLALFLLSDRSSWLTGQNLVISGGR